jgi:hypothetical protein
MFSTRLVSFKKLINHSYLMYAYDAILLLILWFLLHDRLWGGTYYLGWDAVRESWGDLQYAALAFKQGYFPWWNHLERAGYPFLADPQTTVLYPISWLIYIGIYCFGTGLWIPLVRSLLHYLVAIIGMRVLGKSWGYPRWINMAMGLSFILSGRLAKAKDSAGLWTMVWLPWMIWSMQRWVRKPHLSHSILVAVIMSLAFYAGYPPNLYRSCLISLAFAGYQLWCYCRDLSVAQRILHIKRCIFYLVVALLIFFILIAPGVIATLDHLPNSVRTQLSLREILSSRFMFFEVIDVFLPRLIRTQSYAMLYVGLLPSLAVCYATIHWCKKDFFWVSSFIIFALMACGHHAFLLPFLVKYIPTFNLWRISEQYLFVSVFAWLVLAWRGAYLYQVHHLPFSKDKTRDVLKEQSESLGETLLLDKQDQNADQCQSTAYAHRIMLGIIGFLMGVACIGGVYRYTQQGWHISTLRLSYTLATLMMILLVFRYMRSMSARYFIVALLCIHLGDLYLQQMSIYQITQKKPRLTRDRLLPKNLSVGQRIADDQFFRWRVASRSGIPDFLGRYSTMVGARYKRYKDYAEKYPTLWSHASVHSYVGRKAHIQANKQSKNQRLIAKKNKKAHQGKSTNAKLQHHPWIPTFKKKSPYYYQLNHSSYMYWTPHIYTLKESHHVLQQLAKLPPQRLALVEAKDAVHWSSTIQKSIKRYPGFPKVLHSSKSKVKSRIKVQHAAWGHIQAEVSTFQAGILVINEAWNHHWTVHIEAMDLKTKRASMSKIESTSNLMTNDLISNRINYIFQGVFLPAGHWKIKLSYNHTLLKYSFIITGLMMMAIIMFVVYQIRKESLKV